MTKFQKWFDNYWYHYKWHTIMTLLFGSFIIICMIQLLSKKDPDAYIMYAGPASISYTSLDEMQQSFAEIMTQDYNKDRKKHVEYVEITLNDRKRISEDGEIYSEYVNNNLDYQGNMLERYNAEIFAGDSMIYFLSPGIYEDLKTNGQLLPLVSKDLCGDVPDNAFDEYSFKVSDLDIYKLDGLSLLPADTLICMRDPKSRLAVAKVSDKDFQNNAAFFRDLVNYVYIEEAAE